MGVLTKNRPHKEELSQQSLEKALANLLARRDYHIAQLSEENARQGYNTDAESVALNTIQTSIVTVATLLGTYDDGSK